MSIKKNKTVLQRIHDIYVTCKCRVRYFFRRLQRMYRYARVGWAEYDFDGMSMLDAIEVKLKCMREYFSKANFIAEEYYIQYIRDIDICLRCIDIVLDRTSYIEIKYEDANKKLFTPTGEDTFTVNQLKYVNTRNAHRFMHQTVADTFLKPVTCKREQNHRNFLVEDLAQEKAFHLLFLIIEYKLQSWWD